MIDLDKVTLVSIDTTSRIEETIRAVHTSMNGIKYANVKIITTKENIDKYQDSLISDQILLEEPNLK